jgi:ankyrin repeat protein
MGGKAKGFDALPSSIAVPPLLERLLTVIVDDDRAEAKHLIKREPELATLLVQKPRLYHAKITHWLYAKDTPLHLAAAGYRVEIARLLLAAGADVNSSANHRQARPLHYAADGYLPSPSYDPARQVKMIRCLLDAGADLSAADKNGATALHRAVRTRCAAAVQCLLDAGADPTARNRAPSGATPFHLAVQNTGRGGSGDAVAKAAQQRIIELFLERRVSPKTKDARGKSVLDWAAASEGVRRLLPGRRRRPT